MLIVHYEEFITYTEVTYAKVITKVQRGEIEIYCKAVHHMWSGITLHKGS